jgi:cell division protein FtsN
LSTKAFNQTGMAMVIELVLVAAVLVVVGFAGYHAYQSHHQATAADTTPNGKVTNTVNALNADAKAEADASAQETAAVQDADSSSSDLTNVEGSFDESQF